MTSTTRAGRPRKRSRSVHLPSCIPVAPKTVKPRTKSAQRTLTKGKGKGTGKGKKTTKKSNKAVEVVSSDSEDLEVDFPHHHPNQPHEVPTDSPQEPNPPAENPKQRSYKSQKTQQTFLLRDQEKQGSNNHNTHCMFQQKT